MGFNSAFKGLKEICTLDKTMSTTVNTEMKTAQQLVMMVLISVLQMLNYDPPVK
jgi:hypothetical protein